MRQLDPYPTARIFLGNGQSEGVVGGTVVEGAHVFIVRQFEDGVGAVVVDGARGEPAFRDAVVYVVE